MGLNLSIDNATLKGNETMRGPYGYDKGSKMNAQEIYKKLDEKKKAEVDKEKGKDEKDNANES